MTDWLGRRDPEEVLLAAVCVLLVGGGILLVLRSQLTGAALLLGSIVGWAVFCIAMLRDVRYGHDCSRPHHEGELLALVVTIAWGVLVAAVLRRPRTLAIRLGVAAGTGALFVGSLKYVLEAQPPC